MAASPLKTSEENIERKLENVVNTQDSVQSLSLWIIHHKSQYKKIVDVWFKVLKKSSIKHKLTLFNLCNDVVQNGKRKKAPVYLEGFKDVLKEAMCHARDNSIKNNVGRILKIWNERNTFSSDFVKELQDVLTSASPPPVTTTTTSYTPTAAATTTTATTRTYTKIHIDPKVLAEFKPQTLIDKINNFKRMEGEVELKKKQLSNLKLDASSIEAVKQLKDRSHGKQFSKQFEDSCFKLEDYVSSMDKEISERKDLISLMEKSEMFYDEQYREAKIVANAYKNFGTRINNLRKKLEDLKSSLPSPIPSPTMDAPSPGNTPPQLRPDNIEAVDMELDDDDHQQSTSIVSDAPVPIKSTEEYNPTVPSTTASLSVTTDSHHKDEPNAFESRIANMMPALTHDPRHMDVYNPPPVVYNPPPKHRALRAIQTQNGNEQGEGTPVKDEGSSTPVMDEKPEDSPPRSKNQNPIDFLTQILSKTTKSSQGSSFLENLNLLTNTVKSQFQQQKEGEGMQQQTGNHGPPPSVQVQASAPQHQGAGSSPSQQPTPPNSWAEWKAQRAPAPVPPSPPVNPPQLVLPQQQPPRPMLSPIQPPLSHPPMSQPPAMPILSQPLTMPPAMPIMSHHNPGMTGPLPPIPVSQPPQPVSGPPQPIMRPPAAMISPPINGPQVPTQSSPRMQYPPVSGPLPSQPPQPMPPPSPQQGIPMRPGGWMPQPPPQAPQPQNQNFQQMPRYLGPQGFPTQGDQGSPPWRQVQTPQPQTNSQSSDTQDSNPSTSALLSAPSNVLPTPPKSILRNRKSSLREVPLTPEPGENISGGDAHEYLEGPNINIHPPRPPSQPPSPTDSKMPKLSKQNSDPSSGSGVPDDHREFLEKLKRKTAGNSNLVAPPSVDPQDDESKNSAISVFSKHPARSNLTTITPVDFNDDKEMTDAPEKPEESVQEKELESLDTTESVDNSCSAINVISTTNSVRHKAGDNHDPEDIRRLAHPQGRHGDNYSRDRHYNSHRGGGNFEHYSSSMPRSRDSYDPYRDPYYNRNPYRGPPPPKRPFHDPYRRPPYYRY